MTDANGPFFSPPERGASGDADRDEVERGEVERGEVDSPVEQPESDSVLDASEPAEPEGVAAPAFVPPMPAPLPPSASVLAAPTDNAGSERAESAARSELPLTPAPKRPRWVRVLTILNVINILVSGFAGGLALLGSSGAGLVVAVIFPVVPALFMLTPQWFFVFGIAVAIASIVAVAAQRDRWYRFYAVMTALGFAVLTLIPVIVLVVFVSGSL